MAYFRIAIAGPCAQGSASLEWRAKEALEALGHTVFPFCPALQAELFDGRGDLKGSLVGHFLEAQGVDFLLLAQGCLLDGGAVVPASCAVGLLVSGEVYTSRTPDEIAASGVLFALAVGERAQAWASDAGLPEAVPLAAVADAAWVSTPLANTVAPGPFVPTNDPFDNAFAYAVRMGVLGEPPADDFLRALAAANRATEDSPAGTLEDELARGLEEARAVLAPGQAAGTDEPRAVVCAMAYVGRGNFGDEYIYQTIDRRLRRACPGATLVAVSEDPLHTLVHRGTYAISQANLALLDHVLARASVALVLAGLLFDQGIRWTMGVAETFGYPIHSDIPGITEFCTLAHLNGVQPLFYGIGAGPLEVEGGKRLVSLVGELGARFLTRDEETSRLIRACPVPDAQVTTCADAAFLGEVCHVPAVDAWVAENVPAGNGVLAISLRDYETTPADFAERVARALDRFVGSHPTFTPVFCILDPSDAGLSRRIAEGMREGAATRTFDAGDDLDALVDLLGRCRLGLSMRYHCSLVLMRSGVPACGIDYLPKVGALYREVGAGDALLPADASADDLYDVLCRLEDEHDGRSARALASAGEKARLAGEAERVLLSEVEASRAAKAGRIPTTFYVRDVPDVEVRMRAERNRLQAEVDDLRRQLAEVQAEPEPQPGPVHPLARIRNVLRK